MKKPIIEGILILLILGVFVGVAVNPVGADAVMRLDEFQLTTDPADQSEPEIDGGRIVWQDNRNGNWDIYMLSDAPPLALETQITTNNSNQQYPVIHGNRIVYADDRNGNWDIYLYDLGTRTETRITNNTADQRFPAIYGNRIIWQDSRDGHLEIYLHDLGTHAETRITNSINSQSAAIYGDGITYQKTIRDELGYYHQNICMFDLATWREIKILEMAYGESYPAIYRDWIVWADDFFDVIRLNTYTYILMYGPGTPYYGTSITSEYEHRRDPDIFRESSENYIVYQGNRNYYSNTGDWDIYLYNLDTGIETRVTNNSANQFRPMIYGGRIVWQDYRNGNWDIYMSKISYSNPDAPPTPDGSPTFKPPEIVAPGDITPVTVPGIVPVQPEIVAPGDITPVAVPGIVPVQPEIVAPGDITPVAVPGIVPVQPEIIAPGDITPVTVPGIGSPSMPGMAWPSGYGDIESCDNARGIYYNDQIYVFSLWYKGAEPANKNNYGIQLRYFKDNALSGSHGMWGGSSQAEPTPLLVQVPNGSELMFIFVTGENGNIYFTRVNGSHWPDGDWLKIKDSTTGQYITTKVTHLEVAPVYNPIIHRIAVYYCKDHDSPLYWMYSDDYGNNWTSGGVVNNSPIAGSAPGAVFYNSSGTNSNVLLAVKDANQQIRLCYLLDGTIVRSEVLPTPASDNIYGYGRPFLIDLGPNIALMYAAEHGDKAYCSNWYIPHIMVFNKTTQQWGEPYQATTLPDLGTAQGTFQFHWQPNGAFDSKTNTFYLFYGFELCAGYTDETNNGPWWMFIPIKTPGV